MTIVLEVTAEMVMDLAAVTAQRAAGIAAYANRRFAGLLKADAHRESGISEWAAHGAERLLPQLRNRYGLPVPPQGGLDFYPQDWSSRGVSGAHQRHHVGRGVSDPECPRCAGAS